MTAKLMDAYTSLPKLAPATGQRPLELAVRHSGQVVVDECRDVLRTVASVGGALQVFVAPESGWGNYGLAGLPASAAMKVVSTMASQYLQTSTSMGLEAWIDFVDSCSDQFDAFIAHLEETTATPETNLDAGGFGTPTAARVRELTSLRVETSSWKAVLDTVEHLGAVVEAVRVAASDVPDVGTADGDPDLGMAAPVIPPAPRERTDVFIDDSGVVDHHTADDPPAAMARFSPKAEAPLRSMRSRVVAQGKDFISEAKQGVSGISERIRPTAGGLVGWATRPLMELTDQVASLPTHVDELREAVSLLEVLLDLHISTLLVELEEMSESDAVLVQLRVAASVWLPRLIDAVNEIRATLVDIRLRMQRVEELHRNGKVADRAKTLLLNEYRGSLATAQEHADQLELAAATWREHGDDVVHICQEWAAGEVDLLRARAYAEGESADNAQRLALMMREMSRLSVSRDALQRL